METTMGNDRGATLGHWPGYARAQAKGATSPWAWAAAGLQESETVAVVHISVRSMTIIGDLRHICKRQAAKTVTRGAHLCHNWVRIRRAGAITSGSKGIARR